MNQPSSGRGRLGPVIAVVLVLAVGIAAAVSVFRPVADLDPHTPEGVVQAWFRAIEAKDWDAAQALLSPDLAAECTAGDLAAGGYEFDRVTITDVAITDTGTVIEVEVRRTDLSDPLNPYTFEEQMDFRLVGDSPRIDQVPWQFNCGEVK
jgi:hypothetical protein